MPDNNGMLTKEEQERAQKWVKEKWKSWACPFSGDTNWNLGEMVVQAPAFTPNALMVGGPVYPLVPLTCAGCGYTVLLNAIQMGIVVPPQKTSTAEAKASGGEADGKS